MAEDIIIGKEYMSNNYGPFIVLEKLGRISHDKYYKIQFKWSTCIHKATKRFILTGGVGDPWYGININQIQYSNNYGPFKVINFDRNNKNVLVDIIFLNTNTKLRVRLDCAKNGNIKDPNNNHIVPLDTTLLQPNIKEYRIYNFLRTIYNNIKRRCYDTLCDHYNIYGAIGVKVCDRWLKSFDNFYNDAKLLPQYEKFVRFPNIYQLDKDYKQLNIPKEQRIYSPETCMFLYYMDNSNIRMYEYKRDHINELSSPYYGVYRLHGDGSFKVSITIDNVVKNLGCYNNEIAAANMYNHIYDYYHKYVYPRHELIPLYNDVPYMSWNECMQYRTPPSRLLYTLTNEPTISIPEFIKKYKVTKDDIIN